jgi:hypothetical protein
MIVQLLQVERLVDDGGRSELAGSTMRLGISESGDEDQRHLGKPSLEPVQHVEATRARHSQIREHEIGDAAPISGRPKPIDELFAIPAFVHVEASATKRRTQHPPHCGVVVSEDYEKRGHG